MANFNLEVGRAIDTGWQYTKKYGLLVAVIYLLVHVVTGGASSIFNGLFGSSMNPEVLGNVNDAISRGDWEAVARYASLMNSGIASNISTFFTSMIETIVVIGLYNLALGLMTGRFTEVTVNAFKLPIEVYVKAFVVSFLVGLICIVATLCCIVPVFFVAPRLILAPVYQVDNPEAGIIESISASWHMTADNTLSMLGLGIALMFIAFLGLLCCCIGIYVAYPIELFATVAAYYQLKGNLQLSPR
jgi:hypothetical protein